MQIGKTITALRKLKKINQLELAEKSKISQTYLSQIENDKKEPSISTLKMICSAMDIPVQILIFLSLEETDVKEPQRVFYSNIAPFIDSLITKIFLEPEVTDEKHPVDPPVTAHSRGRSSKN